MDVLGHPELLDPTLGRRLAIALGVRRREVLAREGVVVVRTQMHVVVGQHLASSMASATRRSSSVVTLMFSRGASTTAIDAPGGLHERGIVGGSREHGIVDVQRPPQNVGPEHLGRLNRPERGAVERPQHPPIGSGLLHRVGHRSGGNRPINPIKTRDAALHQIPLHERPGGIMNDHDRSLGSRGQRVANRGGPRRTTRDKPCRLSTVDCRLWRSHHNPITNAAQHLEAPLVQRPPPQHDERLGL